MQTVAPWFQKLQFMIDGLKAVPASMQLGGFPPTEWNEHQLAAWSQGWRECDLGSPQSITNRLEQMEEEALGHLHLTMAKIRHACNYALQHVPHGDVATIPTCAIPKSALIFPQLNTNRGVMTHAVVLVDQLPDGHELKGLLPPDEYFEVRFGNGRPAEHALILGPAPSEVAAALYDRPSAVATTKRFRSHQIATGRGEG